MQILRALHPEIVVTLTTSVTRRLVVLRTAGFLVTWTRSVNHVTPSLSRASIMGLETQVCHPSVATTEIVAKSVARPGYGTIPDVCQEPVEAIPTFLRFRIWVRTPAEGVDGIQGGEVFPEEEQHLVSVYAASQMVSAYRVIGEPAYKYL